MILRVTLTLYFTFLKLSPPALAPTFGDLCPRWFGLILVRMGAVYKAPEVGFLIIYKNDHMVCEIQTFCWFSFIHQIYGGSVRRWGAWTIQFPGKDGMEAGRKVHRKLGHARFCVILLHQRGREAQHKHKGFQR